MYYVFYHSAAITIGFLTTNYTVDENVDVTIGIGVVVGSLQGEVVVNVSIVDLDAVGKALNEHI